MSDEAPEKQDGKRRRRRRRRRRSSSREPQTIPDDVLVIEKDPSSPARHRRRQALDLTGPPVNIPATGRNPHRKRSSRTRRQAPRSAGVRRRRLNKVEMGDLQKWLSDLELPQLHALYRGLGGQPTRVGEKDRIVQLASKAVIQGSRVSGLLKSIQEKDRKALAALLHCGGLAHADEFHHELQLSYGGHEREWKRVLVVLANKGVVFASSEQDGEFFYIIPEPLISTLVAELNEELVLPTFNHSEVRVMDARPFCPPLHFSITSLATYIDHHGPRLTQRHEIYRHDQEEMDRFFAQIWTSDSELFGFHLRFLMMHSMVELKGEFLSLNHGVLEEWLQLDPEDQRDLIFRAVDERFEMAEWVLWAIHESTKGPPDESQDLWVAERPLVAMYRRWRRGEDWRDRYKRGVYSKTRTNERESYSFAPLVNSGILEMGQWGQEKFYRLSPRGRQLLEPRKDDGFQQFYLTPSFEIMAPAGLAPILLFRIGELAELTGCDRANTYKITEQSIENALSRGWRREDVLQFLRENSQIGLPENVEQTLKGWIGHRGDVQFHDLMLITVHRSQIRKFEQNRRLKSYILHRFAPGMYGIDRSREQEIRAALDEARFSPFKDVRNYPGDPASVEARNALHKLVGDARKQAVEPAKRSASLVKPSSLRSVPGSRVPTVKQKKKAVELPPEVNFDEVRLLVDRAMSDENDLEMVYVARNGKNLPMTVLPERLAFKADAPVLVGIDRDGDERRTFVLNRIVRLRVLEVSS